MIDAWEVFDTGQSKLADEADRYEEVLSGSSDQGVAFYGTVLVIQIPIKESKPIDLKEDRNLIQLKDKIKTFAVDRLQKSLKEIDTDQLGIANKPVWKTIEWDLNWQMELLRRDGQLVDYRIIIDSTNNPPEIFINRQIVLDIDIIWFHDKPPVRMTFKIGETPE